MKKVSIFCEVETYTLILIEIKVKDGLLCYTKPLYSLDQTKEVLLDTLSEARLDLPCSNLSQDFYSQVGLQTWLNAA